MAISIDNYLLHTNDKGSTALQIINLSNQVEKEKVHLAANKKDVPVKRALLKNIARMRRLLGYLKKTNISFYTSLKSELNIK